MLLGTAGIDPLLPTDGGIVVEIDFDGNGFGEGPPIEELPYSDIYTDAYGIVHSNHLAYVTSQVRPNAQAVNCEYGRDQTTALSPTVAGKGGFVLDNKDRRYSPRNTASPLYGKLKPARPVRITRSIGSLVYGLFTGHTDDTPIQPVIEDSGASNVTIGLLDYLADLRGQTISTALHRDLRTGAAINAVLDACGWSEDLRDIDLGATIIPWWWEDNTDALTAIEKIVRSEGPPALIHQGMDREIIFRDRHHRLTNTLSLISQGTWRGSGPVEPVMAKGFSYDEAWSHIVNTGTASVDVRQAGPLAVVWASEESATVTLSAGEQRIITATSTDPFLNAVTPVAGTDYILKSGSVAVRLIKTSGLSAGIELTAGVGGVMLTALQVRAYPLAVAFTVQVSASDSQSVAEYGPRAFPGDLPWCGVGDAEAVLSVAVALRSQPLPQVSTRFMIGNNAAKATQLLGRDLSDRVTVIEPETGLAGDFYIESIRHELTGVHDHAATFGLEAVPSDVEPLAICDMAGHGTDQGLLSRGIDDPNLVAICDAVGHLLNSSAMAAH